ncbi:MAG: hypothetical protein ACLF0G_05455 [Candidatus Brocadiia bacterium]
MALQQSQVSEEWFLGNVQEVRVLNPSPGDLWRFGLLVPEADRRVHSDGSLGLLFARFDDFLKQKTLWLLKQCNRRIEIKTKGSGVGFLELPPSKRAKVEDVFPFRKRGGDLCVFVDEQLSPTSVRRCHPPGLALIGILGRDLMERWWREVKPKTMLTQDAPPGATVYRRRRRRLEVFEWGPKAGLELVWPLAPPAELGGKKAVIRKHGTKGAGFDLKLSGGTSVHIECPEDADMVECTCPGAPNWGELHDRVAVALGAGWSYGNCRPWFYTIQDTLLEYGICRCVHVSLDTSQTMMSAMRAAYDGRTPSDAEDGIARYGALIDCHALRSDQSIFPTLFAQVLARVRQRPGERFILITDRLN